MAKIAVVALADTETHGDLGRIANALTTANRAAWRHIRGDADD